jgi:hypothetical protein
MRLLSIGYALPNRAVDNYNALTAPSYFDYEAMFIDPASITRIAGQMLEEGTSLEAFDGRPVVNGPTTATAASAAEQLRRRADETQRLLEAGGLVLVMGQPNAVQSGLLGFEGCDRYSWLPAPAGIAWGPPFVRAAEGTTVRIVAEDHPLAGLLREFRAEVTYRAVFDDRQPAFRQAARVIANGGAGVPIAVEFSVLGGRLVFLPALRDSVGSIRSDIAEAIVDAATRLMGRPSAEPEPYWSRTVAVPGLEQVEAELEEAEVAATETSARLAAVRERVDLLSSHRRLLFEDGQPFNTAVTDGLRLLGFAITSGPDERLVIEDEGQKAFVEPESAREQVVEWPYVRLQRRLEAVLLEKSERPKGIVIANGHRQTTPDERGPQFTDALRIACENYRYTLLTGQTLFTLVQRVLGGADETTLAGYRRRILRSTGLLDLEVALGNVEEGSDAGPIF